MSAEALAVAALAVGIGAIVQSSVGFGLNLIAVPILVQIDPDLVPGPILVASLGFSILVLLRDREAVAVRPVSYALAGRVVGTVIGVLVLRQLTDDGLIIAVAIAVLFMVAATTFGPTPRTTPGNMTVAGAISGTTATTAGIGGPPVALVFQRSPGPEIRGSMAGYFLVGSIMTLTGLAIGGRFGLHEIGLGLRLLPAAWIGFLLSGPLLHTVDRGYTRPAILVLSALSAIVLLVRVAA